MKKSILVVALLLACVMMTSAFAEGEPTYPQLTGEAGIYNAGVYQVKVRGMGGYMTINVTFGPDTIDAIDVIKHTETPNIGTVAIERVIPRIIEAQSTDVDAQTSATITSDALKQAVEEAIELAKVPEAEAAAKYKPGTYEATVRGMGGKMTVAVTFTETAFTDIQVTKHTETPNIGTVAIERVIPRMIEAQSTDVDVQTSATITSEALMEAVKDAIAQASL